MNIAALVSGGVDSSVMVYLLKEAGFTPTLFYIQINGDGNEDIMPHCPAEEDIEIAAFIAKKYGCRLEIVSLHNEYWQQVIGYTLQAAKQGLTPHPDIMCNKLIKLGCFNDRWGKDFDKIATGHYATTTLAHGKVWLSTAKDAFKDQTDFLAQITPQQIQKLLFPIGRLLKSEVRNLARRQHLPSALRKDSQGICFLGNIHYNRFLQRYLGQLPGDIIDCHSGKTIGQHNGHWFHTIGQRKGLRLSGGPWFVIKKDIQRNILFVANGYNPPNQYADSIPLQNLHFITQNPWPSLHQPQPIAFKIRHTPDFSHGTIQRRNNALSIASQQPLQGVAPGQFAVLYDPQHQLCFGSAMITPDP